MAAGCSGSSTGAKTLQSSTPTGSSGSGSASTCSETSADQTRSLNVSGGKFDVTCAVVSSKGQIFITNADRQKRTVATTVGAPKPFSVDLPKRTSTFAWRPGKPGEYRLQITPGNGSATVFAR
jgi:hypothetical protein